ncbi:MAG TPA: hypothetical protein PKC73_11000 [Dermatophilaceae bacterium]|nr:hypothetical protein [Dermatophilaceae bacterium]
MSGRLSDSLRERLIDDAAVFPPGSAPLPDAVASHLARTAYRHFVGPLLVPATATNQVLELVGEAAIEVGLIARPGTPIEPVREGVIACIGTPVLVSGVEVGASSAWRTLDDLGVTVTVEIPRDGFEQALDDVAEAAHEYAQVGGPDIQAKFRTGATEVWAWPDEAELARFIHGCVRRRLPFKLTGGLHHVLRADRVDGPQHGLLNVLTAVDAAAAGALPDQIAACLAERSPGPLTDVLLGMTSEEVAEVRAVFRAYGCCTVTDPIGELVELGLLKEEH